MMVKGDKLEGFTLVDKGKGQPVKANLINKAGLPVCPFRFIAG